MILWISQKLKLNGPHGGANATGVIIAVTGVALALVIMQLTISIVLGFKHQITERILGFDGQIWVLPRYLSESGATAATLTPSPALLQVIDSVSPGATTNMRFDQPGLLKTDDNFAGVYFTAFAPGHNYAFERSNIVAGTLPSWSLLNPSDNPSSTGFQPVSPTSDTPVSPTSDTPVSDDNAIVISQTIAKALGLDVDDKVNACFFVNDAIKSRRFTVAGIYESGFGDYDRTVCYASIDALRRIAAVDSTAATRIAIALPEVDGVQPDIEATAAALQNALINAYQQDQLDDLYPVDNVRHTGALYFNWLDLLDTNVVVIFLLMICVAGFTLISSMFIIILERIPTIGILRALGATKRQIRRIFILLTLKVVGLGMLIGNIVAIALQWVQLRWHPISLDAQMYYLHHVPIELNWLYILYLNIGVLLVSWLILILPSRVASSISPSVTMRFE